MIRLISLLFLFLFSFTWAKAQFANRSVLTDGDWYKVRVQESGMYKLDLSALRDMSIPTMVDPRTIKIYGNGGGMLPQVNKDIRKDDLQEIPIMVVGEGDGTFDTSDYILFYAEGADVRVLDGSNYTFQKHLYDQYNYYYITFGGAQGKRVQNAPTISGATQTINTFDAFYRHEEDINNQLHRLGGGSGRHWYGEDLTFDAFKTNVTLEGIVANSQIDLLSSVMAQSTAPSDVQIKINNVSFAQRVDAIPSGVYDVKGKDQIDVFSFKSISKKLDITYTYDKPNNSARAYLDYFELVYQKKLTLYDNQTRFVSLKSLNAPSTRYTLSDITSTIIIWDITDPNQIQNQPLTQSGTSIYFEAESNTLRSFVAFQGSDFPVPTFVSKVPNQNLHALLTPQLLIVTAPTLRSEAERLAQHRRDHDHLDVNVVTTEQIYNEFSSGKQDVSAIRDFVRMLYTREPSTLKYLLLFGDASFDYKDRVDNNSNLVPIYESRESLHPIFSYSSDDYFGFLEPNEGAWKELRFASALDHTLEIGIGRLPAKTMEEARLLVDKLIHYDTSPNTLGDWRKRITFVADDGDNNRHQQDADKISQIVSNDYPAYDIQKIYLDAYPQESTANGQRAPKATKALRDAIDEGALILNYTGHGGEVGWAEEFLLRTEDIQSFDNEDKMPLMITATCEFGRYDEPKIRSGAEVALLMPKGGAIALITTTRPVYSSSNYKLNNELYQVILQKDATGQMPRLGDVMRSTKNGSLSGAINRNFSLLGDPSIQLQYPQHDIKITSDLKIHTQSKVQITGEVQQDGNLLTDFNGFLDIKIFDQPFTKTTLGTENTSPMEYQSFESLLYKGKASVKDGIFSFEFVVPKDVDYSDGDGKISLYAYSPSTNQDANLGKNDLKILGTPLGNLQDDTPPEMRVYLDDTTFRDGDLVSKDPLLLLYLMDQNGINISKAGIGHSITARVDEETPMILDNFYTADLDTYRSGEVIYRMDSLSAGQHTLTVKVWDVFNNATTQSVDFLIANVDQLTIRQLLCYPNPVVDQARFALDHNRVSEDLEINIMIYNLEGQKVKTIHHTLLQSPSHIDIEWDNIDQLDLKSGVYIYKVIVRSLSDQSTVSKTKKMLILR